MPRRPAERVPKLTHHKRSGQGVVRLVDAVTGQYRDLYCGTFDTPEARAKYHRLIGEWEARGRRLPDAHPRNRNGSPSGGGGGSVLVRHVVRGYKRHLEPIVSPSRYGNVCNALDVLSDTHGDTSAARLGPKKLKALRLTMLGMGWSRRTINDRVRAIVAAFRWAASEELVGPEVHAALAAIPNLKAGELPATEPQRVSPAPLAHVERVKPHVAPPVAALIDLQILTGARGGELCIMRPCDLNTTGKVWEYRPTEHKNKHRGHHRVIYLGPRAQAIIQPFLQGREHVGQYLFDPREGNAERKAALATKGKPRRPDQKPSPTATARRIGGHYTADSYRKAIERGCEAAGVPQWNPHQLRHTAATEIRREFGLEAASLVLGHGSARITDAAYAERDAAKVADVLMKIG